MLSRQHPGGHFVDSRISNVDAISNAHMPFQGLARILTCASQSFALCIGLWVPSQAAVFVESYETMIDQKSVVGALQYSWYALPLEIGTTVHLYAQVAGGLDNAIQFWLVDISNFELLKAHQPFNALPDASHRVVQSGYFAFRIPVTMTYYFVLDNRAALGGRNVTLRLDKSSALPTARSNAEKTMFESRYALLKTYFIFDDFDIHVQRCGVVNAFSNPNITICSELIEDTQRENVPAAEMFAFFHEAAHSLLNVWRYPGFDNEDTADEFATVLLIMIQREPAALQAAQWSASKDSASEAKQKVFMDDRHSLSAQRARNIINWLNHKDELLRRWMRTMVPNMTDTLLARLASGASGAVTKDDEQILHSVQDEISRRSNRASQAAAPETDGGGAERTPMTSPNTINASPDSPVEGLNDRARGLVQQIDRLNTARDQGVITKEEYDRKLEALLKRNQKN